MAILEIKDIVVKYGAVMAVQGVSLEIEKGECVALLGANGAGKTTICNAISGSEPLASGEIIFDGKRIDGMPAHEIVRLGIAQLPEGRLVFPQMTVWENLELGSTALKDKARKSELMKQVFSLFPRLEERQYQKAATMSGGEQQMLAFGRALMSDPKVILSDEASMGLAPLVTRSIYDTISHISAEWGVTVLIVEQDAKTGLRVASRCYIIETGKIVISGSSEELAQSDVVRKVYLGES